MKAVSDEVSISRTHLEALITSVEDNWDDHSFAKTSDNPGWVRDREAIKAGKKALRAR